MNPAVLAPKSLEEQYEEYANEYLRNLPLEHFMEAIPQSRQREITLESLALVRAQRDDVHVFNELLVQYPMPGAERPGQVVPDNMVVIHHGPIHARGSYDVPLQPARPFFALEYVSPSSTRKDYEDNFSKYEQELLVPYLLLFYPEAEDLRLYRLTDSGYQLTPVNSAGRQPLPELELEIGLLDGWARFWYRGDLLDLPGDLLRRAEEAERNSQEAKLRSEKAERRREKAERQREEAERQREEANRQREQAALALERERAARLTLERELEALRAEQARFKSP